MHSKNVLMVALLYMLCLVPMEYAVADKEPYTVINEATIAIYRAIQADCEAIEKDPLRLHLLVEEILIPQADFRRMAQLALGKHWKTEPAELRDPFTAEFRQLLIRTYATAVQMASLESIHYLPARPASKPDIAVIRTEVQRPGEPKVTINYSLYRKDGHWLVYDILVDGISLVSSYRATFSEEIRARGLAGLVDTLKAKNQRPLQEDNADLVRKRAVRACK